MPVCKSLQKNVKKIAESLGIQISNELLEYTTDKVEEFLIDILESSSLIAEKNKRKTVNEKDIKEEIESRKIPFYIN
ncbi:hypothetical protein NUSPORA_00333 [Nucleospora cyclopteri]